MLTRKHYKAVAEALNYGIVYGEGRVDTVNLMLDKLIKYFQEDNPNFKKDKFINEVLK
jgi:hypothetical protein